MFINTGFTYDNVSSDDMKVWLVRVNSSGMLEQSFGLSRDIIEESIKGSHKPYFYGFENKPLEFEITICKSDETPWTLVEKQKICSWLFTNSYRDFISEDNTEIIYKCVVVGSPKFYNNYNNQGYATFTMRCDSSHAWSSPFIQQYDLSNNTTSKIIQIENKSNLVDEYLYPELEFELVGDSTSFKLRNLSDGGREFEFINLQAGETVYTDCNKKLILSDNPNVYRLGNLSNKSFFRLVYGVNNCEVFGKCQLTIRYQCPIII